LLLGKNVLGLGAQWIDCGLFVVDLFRGIFGPENEKNWSRSGSKTKKQTFTTKHMFLNLQEKIQTVFYEYEYVKKKKWVLRPILSNSRVLLNYFFAN
jgi:hypothetical protein